MSGSVGEISSEILSAQDEDVKFTSLDAEDQTETATEEDQEETQFTPIEEEEDQPYQVLSPIEVDEDEPYQINTFREEEEEEDHQRITAIEDNDEDEEEEVRGKGRDIHQLPFTKVKRLMRTDEDVNLISKEAIIATAVAAELFVSQLAQQAGRITSATKKRTLTLDHLKAAISENPAFDFLQGAIPGTDI